jgi:Immunity protein 26
MTKQRLKIGSVVEIALGDENTAYGLFISREEMGFYNLLDKGTKRTPVAAIVSTPFAFRIGVMHHAIKSGRWPIIGYTEIPPTISMPNSYFMQDAFTDAFSIYRAGEITPASRAECLGLECAAGWDPEHVEDRLRDHFAGRPNVWVEQLRPR